MTLKQIEDFCYCALRSVITQYPNAKLLEEKLVKMNLLDLEKWWGQIELGNCEKEIKIIQEKIQEYENKKMLELKKEEDLEEAKKWILGQWWWWIIMILSFFIATVWGTKKFLEEEKSSLLTIIIYYVFFAGQVVFLMFGFSFITNFLDTLFDGKFLRAFTQLFGVDFWNATINRWKWLLVNIWWIFTLIINIIGLIQLLSWIASYKENPRSKVHKTILIVQGFNLFIISLYVLFYILEIKIDGVFRGVNGKISWLGFVGLVMIISGIGTLLTDWFIYLFLNIKSKIYK